MGLSCFFLGRGTAFHVVHAGRDSFVVEKSRSHESLFMSDWFVYTAALRIMSCRVMACYVASGSPMLLTIVADYYR